MAILTKVIFVALWATICGIGSCRSIGDGNSLFQRHVLDDRDALWSSGFEHALPFRRQVSSSCLNADIDPDAPFCRTFCGPRSGSCGLKSLPKRGVPWPAHGPINASIVQDPPGHALVRRTLRNVVTQRQIRTYLPNQYNGNEDRYFGAPIPLVEIEADGEPTDATVVEQITFGDRPFAVGSAGLHGCTMITIVSSKAVYMGHFWENPRFVSLSSSDDWIQGVLNYFRGGNTPRVGFGPALDKSLFPPGDTNTRVYIMSPRNTRSLDNPEAPQYRQKLQELRRELAAALNYPSVPYARFLYIAYDYNITAEKEEANTNQRGISLFQYDPQGRGPRSQSTGGWRLFYEHNQFQDTDPPPNSPDGIPDP